MSVFFEVIFPVLLIFSTGYVFQKWKRLDIKSISSVAIFILMPVLVFKTFLEVELNGQYLLIVAFLFLLLFIIIFINKIYSKVMKYPSSVESGLILPTAFMNAGNYGAPIVLFAFGEKGFAYAVIILAIQAFIMNFFGIYYAARGTAGIAAALKTVFKMPATYAVLSALLFRFFNISIPENLWGAINLISNASIPTVMLVLGMQLAEIKLKGFDWGKVSYGLLLRLIISPIIAAGILSLFPIDPLLKNVLIISAAMPAAATTTIYAVQFETEPELVSSITFVTTILSVFTLTNLLIIIT